MVLESVAYALGLWLLSRALAPLLDHLGYMNVGGGSDSPWSRVLPYVGAGLYEETLFRLILLSSMLGLLRVLETPPWLAATLAAVGSATLFAAAHHVAPHGQPYATFLFLFRMAAGLYFAALFQLRGYGIVVGAHACYNLMVSVGVG
jgi:membrane protease YdiL (CAAX protease family)